MDDDERRRRMCTGKARHKDEAAAELAMRTASWNQHAPGRSLRSYHCGYCGRWHLTSQPAR
ncbi:MAG: hypothetical protein ABIX10_05450 [Acidimicrobiales bacterium]